MEIPLKYKYRSLGRGHKQQKGGHNNNRTGFPKHVPHPLVMGFKVRRYHCEPKWNYCPADEWRTVNGYGG